MPLWAVFMRWGAGHACMDDFVVMSGVLHDCLNMAACADRQCKRHFCFSWTHGNGSSRKCRHAVWYNPRGPVVFLFIHYE